MATLQFKKTAGKMEYVSSAVAATGSSVALHVDMEPGKGGAVINVQQSISGKTWTTSARWKSSDATEEVTVGGLKPTQKVRLVVSGAKVTSMEALA